MRSLFAPGGQRIDGTTDVWERTIVQCSTYSEAVHRWAYAEAGWPDKGWPYDYMPRWLRPIWHHDTVVDAYLDDLIKTEPYDCPRCGQPKPPGLRCPHCEPLRP